MKWGGYGPGKDAMNDRHRVRLICEDGCGASLWLRIDGARDVEPHRDALCALVVTIARADGWRGGRCPSCVKWTEPRLADGTAPGTAKVQDAAPIAICTCEHTEAEHAPYAAGYSRCSRCPCALFGTGGMTNAAFRSVQRDRWRALGVEKEGPGYAEHCATVEQVRREVTPSSPALACVGDPDACDCAECTAMRRGE